MCTECARSRSRAADPAAFDLVRWCDDGESACKRDPVTVLAGGRWPSIYAVYPKVRRTSIPGHRPGPRGAERTGRPYLLLDLAPGGVCRADRVTSDAGALLPHRFTLACAVAGHRRFAFCCTGPSRRRDLALASTLPVGVPTFLDTVMPCRGHPADSPSGCEAIWRGARAGAQRGFGP